MQKGLTIMSSWGDDDDMARRGGLTAASGGQMGVADFAKI